MMMKTLPLAVFIVVFSICNSVLNDAKAQGGGCIEIKSILVDACGSPEGENEMALFEVGPNDLNIANMNVVWPNNPWLGLCQNVTTASIVTAVNQIIQGCGSLTEPVGGVLPANSKVLLLTSTNINTTFNSFANLNDNLIVLFQCAGNTNGHFANYNTLPGLRTLVIEFTGPGGCSDTVTYDRTLLVNQFGAIGGFSFENDGAFVDFTTSGTPTYLNFGCQVLSTGFSLTGGPDVGICPGGNGTASLNGSALNLVGNPQWSGGTGSFNPPNNLSTIYTPGPGETGLVNITVTGNGPCNTTITDTVRVNIVTSLPSVTLSVSASGVFISSFADPGYFYNWYSTGSPNAIQGAFNPTYTPTANGCYYMILSTIGGCTVQTDTACITNVGFADPFEGSSVTMINSPGAFPSLILNSGNVLGKLTMEVFDIFGRMVISHPIEIKNNITEINPDWSDVSAGVYIIRLSNRNGSLEGKAILTK